MNEIDYEALVVKAESHGHKQGTRRCVAFADGARWMHELMSVVVEGLEQRLLDQAQRHALEIDAAHHAAPLLNTDGKIERLQEIVRVSSRQHNDLQKELNAVRKRIKDGIPDGFVLQRKTERDALMALVGEVTA